MNNVTKNRWQVRVAATIIFVLGFTAGILSLNVYRGWVPRGGARDRMAELSERLQLTADQKTRVQEIFNDTREQLRAVRQETEPRMEEIRRQADGRLQTVLTPAQWDQFQRLREERGRRDLHDLGVPRVGELPGEQHRPLDPGVAQHVQRWRQVVRHRRPDRGTADLHAVERVLLAHEEADRPRLPARLGEALTTDQEIETPDMIDAAPTAPDPMAAVGQACLILALATCAYGIGASIYGARSGRPDWVDSGRRAVYGLAVLTTAAFAVPASGRVGS